MSIEQNTVTFHGPELDILQENKLVKEYLYVLQIS